MLCKINKGVLRTPFFYDRNVNIFYPFWIFLILHVLTMITSETPYKLAEIIRDTWPNLYRPPAKPIDIKQKRNYNK